jgi:outer membrane protein assembly factor BamB
VARADLEVVSSPALANGMVYMTCTDGKLYAFDAGTGVPLWNYDTSDFIRSSPTAANGVVYVSSENGTLFALNAYTGAFLWRHAIGSEDQDFASPAVANGVVYAGSHDGNLYAFHLPGH